MAGKKNSVAVRGLDFGLPWTNANCVSLGHLLNPFSLSYFIYHMGTMTVPFP